MRSLQWQPLYLSELTTGSQVDLVQLMQEIRSVQLHTRRALPVLVDMNIHYRLMKLLYSVNTMHLDMRMWLSAFPLLYGVWHPYKYCVQMVFRKFFPIFILLESTDHTVGKELSCQRKVLHVEKLVAALLLMRHRIRDRIQAKRATLASSSGTRSCEERWLSGLESLIDFYCPVLFQIGAGVRECTWAGRESHSAVNARAVLADCLSLLIRQYFLDVFCS